MRSEHQLVKSVYAFMASEWIAWRYRPRMVLMWRNPLNMLAGFAKLGGQVGVRPQVASLLVSSDAWPMPEKGAVEQAAWTLCARINALLEPAQRHPEWLVVNHEELCLDPGNAHRAVIERIGLEWSDAVEEYLAASDRPGEGYDRLRRTREQPTAWKRHLSAADARAAMRQMERFASLPGIGPHLKVSLATV